MVLCPFHSCNGTPTDERDMSEVYNVGTLIADAKKTISQSLVGPTNAARRESGNEQETEI